jgi:DNA-directed RNA polymerase specialized sigma24 family protein
VSSTSTPPPPPSSGDLDDEVGDSVLEEHGSPVDDEAPLPPDAEALDEKADGSPPVTRELTNAFLATKAALARIREVVEARVPKGVQEADIKDIVQKTLLKLLATTSLAKTVGGLRPWASRAAQNTVIDHYRGDKKHLVWLRRDVDVQELPPDEAVDGDEEERKLEPVPRPPVEEPDKGMLGTWIDAQPLSKADRLTLEMLRDHAKKGGNNDDLAARFGMTTAAWDNRLLRFKQKWVPRWKKHRRDRVLLFLVIGAALIAIAIAVLRWLGKPADTVKPDYSVAPRPRAVPSADAAPPDDGRFNQAVPPEDEPQGPPLKR